MTGHVPGVAVDTVATVADAHALGRHIASLSAVEQADFLAGWAPFATQSDLADAIVLGKSPGSIARCLTMLARMIERRLFDEERAS